jgi:hypothetical protein
MHASIPEAFAITSQHNCVRKNFTYSRGGAISRGIVKYNYSNLKKSAAASSDFRARTVMARRLCAAKRTAMRGRLHPLMPPKP